MNQLWFALPSILLVSIANTLLKWRMDRLGQGYGVIKKISLIFFYESSC